MHHPHPHSSPTRLAGAGLRLRVWNWVCQIALLAATGGWVEAAVLDDAQSRQWIARTLGILTNHHEFTRLEFHDDVDAGQKIAKARQAHPDRHPEGYFASGFIAASQSNTFFLQEAEMTLDGRLVPLEGTPIYGKSYDHYWMLSPPILRITSLQDGEIEGQSKVFKASVMAGAVHGFRKALYLGMGELVEGETPVATGWNRFETVTPLGGKITGVLTVTNAVVRIDYRLEKHPTFEGWVELDIPSSADAPFPSRVVNGSLRDGGVWGPFEGRYFKFELGRTAFPPQSRGYVPSQFFDPADSGGSNSLRTVVYGPNEIRMIDHEGDRTVYPRAKPPGDAKPKSWFWFVTLFATVNTIGLGGYAFLSNRGQLKSIVKP